MRPLESGEEVRKNPAGVALRRLAGMRAGRYLAYTPGETDPMARMEP